MRERHLSAGILPLLLAGSLITLPTTAQSTKGSLKSGPPPALAAPTLSCFASTAETITLEICAGSISYNGSTYGADAGFSIQWMTCDDFTNGTTTLVDNGDGTFTTVVVNLPGQWPADSDLAASVGILCKASFSGQAHETFWNLGPNECRQITIGALNDLIADPNVPGGGPSGGVSTNCGDPLTCETCYVFRAFAHAVPGTSQPKRSAFGSTLTCSTGACEMQDEIDACAFTIGGWAQSTCNGTNVACLRDAYFDMIYPTGLVVGGTRTLTFTTSAAVAVYEGAGGPSSGNVFNGSYVDPTSHNLTGGGNLARQVVGLRLNVDYGDFGVSCPGGCMGTALGDLVLCNLMGGNLSIDGSALTPAQESALNGQSIRQVLAAAEAYLGGAGLVLVPYGLSHGQLTGLVSQFNEGFEDDLDGDGDCDPATGFSMDFVCLP